MDRKEIMETSVWGLYEKGQNYHRRTGIYVDTDRNHRMFNGNQWEGAKLGGVEPVQKNFIKSIVKYKLSVIHANLYAINFSSQNYENREFRKAAEEYCEMLNRYAANLWERDKMDDKGRSITKAAAINDEGVLYVYFDKDKKTPVNEVITKSDIYYGNENSEDIQAQPYILIRQRMPVVNAVDLALSLGMSEGKTEFIIGDNDTFEESGEAAKEEVDDQVTVVYKFYKKNGTVHYSVATRWVDIVSDADLGIALYPVAHFTWEEKVGSARGEGEVRNLIPNQIEVNRTEMRRVLTVKQQAYPIKVVDTTKVANPQELGNVGAIIRTQGNTVDDVHKIVGIIPPAQMSPDVVQLQNDLIQITRDLAGAGDTATGNVNPESASGRAILAVQQASQAPMTEQRERYKNFIEDVARIWLEYLIAYSDGGINMEQEVTGANGEKTVQIVNVPQSALQQLQASVRIDITPKGVYDKFAQEQSLENFLLNGLFSAQRLTEFEAYVEALDDDSVAPKQKLQAICERMRDEQKRIALIEAQAHEMQQRAQQFLMGDPDEQSSMMADAMMQGAPAEEEAPMEGDGEDEEAVEVMEDNPDDN